MIYVDTYTQTQTNLFVPQFFPQIKKEQRRTLRNWTVNSKTKSIFFISLSLGFCLLLLPLILVLTRIFLFFIWMLVIRVVFLLMRLWNVTIVYMIITVFIFYIWIWRTLKLGLLLHHIQTVHYIYDNKLFLWSVAIHKNYVLPFMLLFI